MLILYTATLVNSFINSNRFCVESLGLSIQSILSFAYAYNEYFTSSFAIWIPFSCLIAVSRTPITVLNRSGKSVHPCLVPEFSGKDFSFSTFSVILAVGLLSMAFIMLRYVPTVPSLVRIFIMMDVEFYQMLFLHLLR